jgi:hypothetical protein
MDELPPGEYIKVGGDVDEVSVSVRVSGEDLDPAQITALLGVPPTLAHRRGDAFGGGRGVRRAGLWSLSVPKSREWELADAVSTLLDQLPSERDVWVSLASRFQVDLFCGLFLNEWNRGVGLPSTLIQQIADRGMELNLDIYCNRDPD